MRQPEGAHHARELVRLVVRDEGHSHAARPRTGGPPHAVHVVLPRGGNVVVDHVRDPRDIDPARCHVRCHERVDDTRLEVRERAFALTLRLVPVHRHGLDPVGRQPFDQPVGAPLGAHEHECQSALGTTQLGHQARDLPLVGDHVKTVLDVSPALGRVRVLVTARVARVCLGDAPHLALQRGAEQERLALG